MKVYISVDMEGVSSIVSFDEVSADKLSYEQARALMTEEVNAAIDGALEAGAKEILVSDSHSVMRNLIPEKLRSEAKLIRGWPRPLSQMQGIDESFDAVFFIGYHPMGGTHRGLLDHTLDSRIVSEVRINGTPVGEVGINAMIAGHFNVPVVLVTGGRAVVEEAKMLLGEVEGIIVKDDVGRHAAICLHPFEARKRIREAATNALRRLARFKPFTPKRPVELEVDFMSSGMAEMAELLPNSERVKPRTVRYTSGNYLEVYKALRAMISLAREMIFERV
jgi:D-amino peptidase